MLRMASPGPNKLYINPQTNLSPYRSRSEPKPNEVRVARPFASNPSACSLITSPRQSTKKDHSVFFYAWGLAKISSFATMLRMTSPGPNKLYINPQTNLSPYRSRSQTSDLKFPLKVYKFH